MKKIFFSIIIILSLIYIVNSIRYIHTLLQKQELISAAQNELQKTQKENQLLQKQLQVVNNPSFVEEEARNKLFMIKPGESTVFIAKNLLATNEEKQVKQREKPNWQQWIDLFY